MAVTLPLAAREAPQGQRTPGTATAPESQRWRREAGGLAWSWQVARGSLRGRATTSWSRPKWTFRADCPAPSATETIRRLPASSPTAGKPRSPRGVPSRDRGFRFMKIPEASRTQSLPSGLSSEGHPHLTPTEVPTLARRPRESLPEARKVSRGLDQKRDAPFGMPIAARSIAQTRSARCSPASDPKPAVPSVKSPVGPALLLRAAVPPPRLPSTHQFMNKAG